jgi:tonB-linked outer membrane protein, susC/ragA family
MNPKQSWNIRWAARLLLVAGGLTVTGTASGEPANPSSPAPVQANNITVTGEVVDSNGEPVIGATILAKGSGQGAATDLDGKFSLSVPKGATLVISYVGCVTQEVKASATPMKITLQETSLNLNEVVVVGFATQKKVNLTGAVGTASGKDIADRPVSDAVTALQGIIPGLNISNSNAGGELNANKSINIRGTATIGEGSSGSPLILIDGMEGDLNTINPQDIENISVLKDAAASSIYGSRAPFGVILVTTKTGSKGKSLVRYNNSFRFSQPLKIANQMDSWHLVNYLNDVQRYTSPGSFTFDDEYVEKVRQYYSGESDVVADSYHWEDGHAIWGESELMGVYANTDWMDEYYKKTAFSQEHNLALTGGNDKIDYYVSGNWMDMGGFMRYGEDDFQRFSFMGKVNAQLYSWLKIGFTSRWNRTDYDRATTMSGGFYDNLMRRAISIAPKYDPNGYLASDFNYIDALENGGRHKEQNDVFTNQFQVTITPVKDWNIVGEFNARVNSNWTHEDGFPVYAHDAVNPEKTHIPTYYSRTTSYVSEYSYRSTYLNANIFTNYYLSLNDKHDFTFLLGTQIESFKDRFVNGSRNDVTTQLLPVLDLTNSKTDYSLGGRYQLWRTVGFFGRINYGYMNRYLLEVNLRYDGTSRFRSDSRWVWSPSVSAGWNIAQENFFEPAKQYVDVLKIRGSYGQLANQNTTNWYPTYQVMGLGSSASPWLINGEQSNTAWFPGLISTTLTWEKIRNTNIGVDVTALNNRLTASFDYFWRDNKDMVGPGVSLPATLGTTPPAQNLLSMRTTGWELSLGWRQAVGDFSYDVRFNLSDDRTKITDYPNREGNLGKYIAGRYTGEIWGLETKGIARTQEEMDAHLANVDQSEINGGLWQAGDIMYVDTDGDGKIHKQSTIYEKGDLRVIGNSSPRYRIGLNLYAKWKGIDFSAFFQGVCKRDYYFSPSGGQGAGEKGAAFWGATVGGRWESLFFDEHLDYWRDDTSKLGENYDAYYARPLYFTNKNRETQTRYLQDGSYLRLKNIQIGYTFPDNLTKKFYVQNLRIFFSAENLHTWTKMSKVIDPESLEVSKMKSGGTYPLSRTFSFGVSVTL